MIVRLKRRNGCYPSLSTRQAYMVIGIEADALRILDDAGRPYLYPSQLFTIVDRREPADWVTEVGDEGECYAYPPPLNRPGFFEDFFEGKSQAVSRFWRTLNQRLSARFKDLIPGCYPLVMLRYWRCVAKQAWNWAGGKFGGAPSPIALVLASVDT